jgi:release factor glutamine methyltransferase
VEGRPRRIVDLGTGTGAIALSIAAEREEVEVLATDASAEALDVARANLAGIGRRGSAVTLYKGSWFSALPPVLAGSIDLLVSNPPYVAADEELPVEVGDWDPHRALVAGPGGTECLDLIVDAAPAWLARPASLVLELAPHQAQLVAGRATQAGATVMVHDDLSGRPRCVVARFS